jgi:hypothetical protein
MALSRDMPNAGVNGLKFNDEQSGLKADVSIDLYVYPNQRDLLDAILYEPSWTGGLAFPIIILC